MLFRYASVNYMSETSLRKHSPPNIMARHQTLRRAMASTSAKMPRRLKDTCFSEGREVQKRRHNLLRRQAAACGVFSIAHPPHLYPRIRAKNFHRLRRKLPRRVTVAVRVSRTVVTHATKLSLLSVVFVAFHRQAGSLAAVK